MELVVLLIPQLDPNQNICRVIGLLYPPQINTKHLKDCIQVLKTK